MRPIKGLPISEKSPILSKILCLTNSSLNLKISFRMPSSVSIISFCRLGLEADLLDLGYEFQSASIQDRYFEVIYFDNGIIDPQNIKRRKQVLYCGEKYATFHQRRGVSHTGHILNVGFNTKIVQIDPFKHKPGIRRSRYHFEIHRSAGMKANSREGNCGCECLLEFQQPKLLKEGSGK